MTESRGIIRQPSPSVPQRPISVTKGNIEACASNAEILEDQAIAEMNASTQRVYAAARAAFPERNDPMVIFSEALIGAGPAMARASRLLNKASAKRLRCILAGGATSSGLAPERTLLSNTMIDAGSNDINGRNYTLDGDARPQHQSRPGRKAVLRAVAVVLLISVGIGGEHWRAGGRSDSSLSQRVAGLNHAERAWAEAVIDASQAGQSDKALIGFRGGEASIGKRGREALVREQKRA